MWERILIPMLVTVITELAKNKYGSPVKTVKVAK